MLRTIILGLGLILLGGQARALQEPVSFGPRAGLTSWDAVDQVHVGAHAILAEIMPNIDFTPGVELGFGDDLTLLAVNGDLTYRFTELTTVPWGLYGGSGLSLLYRDSDHIDGKTDLGLNAVVGGTYQLTGGNRLLAEVRLGIMDAPDFKLTFGFTFNP